MNLKKTMRHFKKKDFKKKMIYLLIGATLYFGGKEIIRNSTIPDETPYRKASVHTLKDMNNTNVIVEGRPSFLRTDIPYMPGTQIREGFLFDLISDHDSCRVFQDYWYGNSCTASDLPAINALEEAIKKQENIVIYGESDRSTLDNVLLAKYIKIREQLYPVYK